MNYSVTKDLPQQFKVTFSYTTKRINETKLMANAFT